MAVVVNVFAGRLEGNVVELAQPVDFIPMFPDVIVLQRDMERL